jgi:Protein of unknown function (DUF4019)
MGNFLFCARVIFLAALAAGLAQEPLLAMQAPPQAEAAGDPHLAEEQAAQRQALGFLGYLDHGRYADSYAYTGMLIRSQLDRDAFSTQVEKTRAGTGTIQSRDLTDATYTTSLPEAPEGQYVVLHYHASFANRPDTVETLTLAFAKGYWRVSGYYIK